jgi:hypothetical protein
VNDFDSIYAQVVETMRQRLEAERAAPVVFEDSRLARFCFLALPLHTLLLVESNGDFVASAYYKILDIMPEPSEITAAVDRIARGLPREQFIDDLLADPRLLARPVLMGED